MTQSEVIARQIHNIRQELEQADAALRARIQTLPEFHSVEKLKEQLAAIERLQRSVLTRTFEPNWLERHISAVVDGLKWKQD